MSVIYTLLTGTALAVLVALLITLPLLINEKRLRRLAEAQLEASQVATEFERSMLKGEFRYGETCHDVLYKIVYHGQFDTEPVSLGDLCSLPTKEQRLLIKILQEELKTKPAEIQERVERFLNASRRAFHFRQPIRYYLFCSWVLILAGGIILVIVSLFSLYGAKKTWERVRDLVSEWIVVFGQEDSNPTISSRLQT
jgi:hypothetical protein